MKVHLVMPMGGAGSRFYKNGYVMPKPLIEIKEKPFFYWSVLSIKKFVEVEDITFTVLKQHIDEFKIDSVIKSFFPDSKIIILPEILPGPVFTSMESIKTFSDDLPIIFNDCDHMFKCSSLYSALQNNEFNEAGALLTFESNLPQYSYVRYDENSNITGTIEKKVVSSHAICGAYIFKNAKLFEKFAQQYIQVCPYSECFMSGIYNVICDNGLKVKEFPLDFHVEYGTPEEYEIAKNSLHFKEFM